MKKTKWFAAGTKPTIPGVYETASEDGSYQHWNGRIWGACAGTVDIAAYAHNTVSRYQLPLWRGLASDPSKAGSKA